MLKLILKNQRVILEALRDGTDTEWITKEIDKQIEAISEELSKSSEKKVFELEQKIKDLKEFIREKTDLDTANYLEQQIREICGNI